jgi:hypothetical protein
MDRIDQAALPVSWSEIDPERRSARRSVYEAK